MSVLEEKQGLADERKEKSVAQRKKEAAELRPVRNYDKAATSTGDFVKESLPADEDDVEEEVVKTPKGKKDPQAELAKKNAAADAKRKADLAAKRAEEADEEEEETEEEEEDTAPAKVAPATKPVVKK